MNDLNQVLLPLAQAAAAALGAMHLKVKGSSVLVHMLGSHRMGLGNDRVNLFLAEAVGVLTLNISVNAYRSEHMRHHALATFADPTGEAPDPDAAFIASLGFLPGMSERALWGRFVLTLVSPQLHWPMTRARLAGVFLHGPPLRRAAAALFWGGLAGAAASGGWLAPLLLGFVLPLLLWGNMGSFLELASEHAWGIREPKGRQRQAELSHARLPGAPPPSSCVPTAWLVWGARMALAAMARFTVLPGDLTHHDAHHVGLRPALKLDRHGWTNAAHEFSPALWADEARDTAENPAPSRHRVAGVLPAVARWFAKLSAERPR